jgi:hypothetical protein
VDPAPLADFGGLIRAKPRQAVPGSAQLVTEE